MTYIKYDPSETGTQLLKLRKAIIAIGGATFALYYSEVDDGWWVEIKINQIGGDNCFIGNSRTFNTAIAHALEWIEEKHDIVIDA
jgi:hypothetical protein